MFHSLTTRLKKIFAVSAMSISALNLPLYASDVTIQVRDGSNAAVANAIVYALVYGNRGPDGTFTQVGTTDGSGNKTFTLDASKQYTFVASAAGKGPMARSQMMSSSALRLSGTTTVGTSKLTLSQDMSTGRGTVNVSVQNATSGSFIMVNLRKKSSNTEVQIGGCKESAGSCTVALHNIPTGVSGTYEVGAYDPNLFNGTGGGVGGTVSTDLSENGSVSVTLDMANAMPPNVSSNGSLRPDANNAVIRLSLRKTGDLNTVIPKTFVEILVLENSNWQPRGGTQTDDSGVAEFKMGTGSYAFRTSFNCPTGSAPCYDGRALPATSSPDVTIAGGQLNTTIVIDPPITVPLAAEGTGVLRVKAVKSGTATAIPYANINMYPDWSRWMPAASGSVNCGLASPAVSGPAHAQKNMNASDGSALFEKLNDGNYVLQVWTPFAQQGTIFNAGTDGEWSNGGGIQGCPEIDGSTDNLRLNVNGTTIKVYDTSGVDKTSDYVSTDSNGKPQILVNVATSLDSADGKVVGTITFPEATDALVNISLSQCDQDGCIGNFTSVGGTGTPATTRNYEIRVPTTKGSNAAEYFMEVRCETYGRVFAEGNESRVKFLTGTTQTRVDFSMARSGIVEGYIIKPDGSRFIPTDGPNGGWAGVNFHGEHSWANAQVGRDGLFHAIGLLPGKYEIEPQMSGGSYASKIPLETVTVTVGTTVRKDATLVDGQYLMPVWNTSGLPSLLADTSRGWVRGETYNVIMTKAGKTIDSPFLTRMLTHGDERSQFNMNFNNQCGNFTGWCPQALPVGLSSDLYAIRQGSMERVGNEDIYSYVVFLSKLENVAIDPSKAPNPPNTVTTNNGTINPIRVSFSPSYGGSLVEFSGLVRAENLFRKVDFEKMDGNFENFTKYIPTLSVIDTNGKLVAAGLITPSPADVGDGAAKGKQIDAAIANNDFDSFIVLTKGMEWRYRVRGIPAAAKYILTLTSPNYPGLTKVVDGTQNQVWNVNWDVDGKAGGTIAGVISDSNGVLANANVEIRTRGVTKSVTTDAVGAYKFEGLPIGTYKVTASAASHGPRAEKDVISDQETDTVSIALPASNGTISGTVSKYMASSGALLKVGAANVDVFAYNDTYHVANPRKPLALLTTQTSTDGTYTLEGAESGAVYKVTFKLDGFYPETVEATAVAGNSANNDAVLRQRGLEVKVKIRHDNDNKRFLVAILNPQAFEDGKVYLNKGRATYDAASATDISSIFEKNPGDGSLAGYLADTDVSEVNNLHIDAFPSDGGVTVKKDLTFGTNISGRTEQPIDNLFVAADGDNDVQGPDDRTTVTIPQGTLQNGNGTDTPTLGIALNDISSVGGSTDDGGKLIGDAAQVNLNNVQADPDGELQMSLPIDPNLVEGGVNGDNVVVYKQDSDGNWTALDGTAAYDPVTQTVQVGFNPAEVLTQAPLTGSAVRNLSIANTKPASIAAIKTGRQIKKNPRAAAAVAGTFAVGVGASGGATAIGYHQYNFPNPFNLKDKTVAVRFGTTGVPSSIRGTYIVVAPTGAGSPEVKIRIYNTAGDLVRELKGTCAAGQYNYFHWDGRNTSGDDVASGVYFAAVDAPGAPKREPIKLVVVK